MVLRTLLSFVSLVEAFGEVQPRKAGKVKNTAEHENSVYVRTLKNWTKALHERHAPLSQGTTTTFFRLFFPGEDVSRKYGLRETRLARYLAHILGADTILGTWNEENAEGCLGVELRKVLEKGSSVSGWNATLGACINSSLQGGAESRSMNDIDDLLSKLASTSAFSSTDLRASISPRHKPREILCDLYRLATPVSAAVITQIILKDLRPLLYPLKESHYRAQLLQYNSQAVYMLTKEQAAWVWDSTGKMAGALKTRASLYEAIEACENPEHFVRPKIGVSIPVSTPDACRKFARP
jgi:DNA ligase 4